MHMLVNVGGDSGTGSGNKLLLIPREILLLLLVKKFLQQILLALDLYIVNVELPTWVSQMPYLTPSCI